MTNFVNLSDVFITPDATASVVTFTGATTATTGVVGLVPEAQTGDTNSFLRGDAQWIGIGALTQEGEVTAAQAISSNSIYTLNPASGPFSLTLPAATGSQDRIYFYGGANLASSSAVTIGVPSGNLNNVSGGTFSATNEGEVLLAVDRGVGEWDLQVLGAGASTSLVYGRMELTYEIIKEISGLSDADAIGSYTFTLPAQSTAQGIIVPLSGTSLNQGGVTFEAPTNGTYADPVGSAAYIGSTNESSMIIPKTGVYEVNFLPPNIQDTTIDQDGPAYYLMVNGVAVRYHQTTADPTAYTDLYEFNAGDRIQMGVSTGNLDNSADSVDIIFTADIDDPDSFVQSSIISFIQIQEVPSSEVVLAGMVTTEALNYEEVFVDTFSLGTGTGNIDITGAALTVPADGDYIVGYEGSFVTVNQTADNFQASWFVTIGGVEDTDLQCFMRTIEDGGGNDMSMTGTKTKKLSLTAGQVIQLGINQFTIPPQSTEARTSHLYIQQLASTTVIDSTDLPTDIQTNWNVGEVAMWDGTKLISSAVSTTDTYVTGGTMISSAATITFEDNQGGSFSVTGISSVDTYVTGGTFESSASTLTFEDNQGGSFSVTGISSSSYEQIITVADWSTGATGSSIYTLSIPASAHSLSVISNVVVFEGFNIVELDTVLVDTNNDVILTVASIPSDERFDGKVYLQS